MPHETYPTITPVTAKIMDEYFPAIYRLATQTGSALA